MASSLLELITAQIDHTLKSFFKSRSVDPSVIVCSDIKVSKCLKSPGEMFVVLSQPQSSSTPTNNHCKSLIIKEIQEYIRDIIITSRGMGTAPSTPPNYIDEVIIKDNGIVYFKLNNILIFKRTILDVLASKEKYGIDKAMNNNGLNVVICPVHCYGNSKSGRHGDDDIGLSCGGCKSSHCHSLSLEDGRVIMVSRLLANLTSPQRATERTLSLPVDCICSPHAKEITDPLLKTMPPGGVTMDTVPMDEDIGKSESMFLASLLLFSVTSEKELLIVNGEKFILEKNILGFSRNIKLIEVMKCGNLTSIGKTAITLYQHARTMDSRKVESTIVIATYHRNTFMCQQAIILTHMALSTQKISNINFKIVEVGSVTCSSATPILSIDDYVDVKMAEVIQSCEIKYGKVEKDSSLKSIMYNMADAAVKFDMLGTDPRKTLKLEVAGSIPGATGDARSNGTFVLYNYARLATLVVNYKKNSEKGIYPPLPTDFDMVDYSLLKEQEEWNLLFSSVFLFPSILKEATDLMSEKHSSLLTQTGVKKLCQFLCKMCHSFSCYYSRVKILLGPEPHLRPLIQARITLVLALKQVLYNGLQLLDIEPLDQL